MTKIILALVLSSIPMFTAAQVVRDTGVPCSVLTEDATSQERKYCSKTATVEDYCKAMTSDTTAKSRKLCEKKAADAAKSASAPK